MKTSIQTLLAILLASMAFGLGGCGGGEDEQEFSHCYSSANSFGCCTTRCNASGSSCSTFCS